MTELRHRVPVRTAPDRVAWEKEHGKAPVKLEDVPQPWLELAAKLHTADASTLDFAEAIKTHEQLAALEERVASKLLPEEVARENVGDDVAAVFYDPAERAFYHYPQHD